MRKNICIRFVEMFIGSVVMSSIVCFICVFGLLTADSWTRNATLTALPIIYIVWNFRILRRCYFEMFDDKQYYITNLFATGAFIAISMFAFILLPRKSYSWLFLVTGLGSFLNVNIPSTIAILTFHSILFVSIFLAPIGLGWIKMKAKEEEELLERIPGILEINPLEQSHGNTEVSTNENKEKEEKNPLP